MPKVTKKQLSKSSLVQILIILLVAFSLAGFYALTQIKSNVSRSSVPNKPVCRSYGYQGEEYFLDLYTVKPGDSLLSISKNELGTTSRVNEIIELNKDKYQISLSKSFLESGWELLLPPEDVKETSGQLIAIQGVISDIRESDGSWEISGPGGHFATISPDDGTALFATKPFKINDCITAIKDEKTNKILKVYPQIIPLESE
ncbi:MAG: LysM peptidoglycan-binding domain-containing protein [bacterium]